MCSTTKCRNERRESFAADGFQPQRHRRKTSGRRDGAGLGIQLGSHAHYLAGFAAVDYAQRWHRAWRIGAARRRHNITHAACSTAWRTTQNSHSRIFQCRGFQCVLRVFAGLWHDLTGRRHCLFDADLGIAAGVADFERKSYAGESDRASALRGGPCDPYLAAGGGWFAAGRTIRARLRLELGSGHDFPEGGEAQDADSCRNILAAFVRIADADCGMLAFEGLPHLWPLPAHVVAWIGYNGLIGMGLAYFIWFVVATSSRR